MMDPRLRGHDAIWYPTSMQWHAPASDRLVIEPLDIVTAVYDRESGQTHVVMPPLPEILVVLADGPADDTAILSRLTQKFDLGEGDAAAILAERLNELAALGLIERR
jgi:PqqD family protein of HPr-rel-A system